MFNRISAFSLQHLAIHLGEIVANNPLQNPFAQEWIVVQNKEQQHWLSLELAKQNGIAANLRFILPSELTWSLFRETYPDLPKQLPSDRLAMQWSVFDLLKSESDALFRFGLNPVTGVRERLNFAAQVADVFDLYQMFRQDMLQKWSKGNFHGIPKEYNWQPFLWRQLQSQWQKKYPDYPARDEVQQLLISDIQANRHSLPERIHFFGLSHWSKPFSEIVTAISKVRDIHFYEVEYGVSKNESELGKTLNSWASPKYEAEKLLPVSKNRVSGFPTDQHIQNLALEFHSCYNQKREVEILKNELLRQFDSDSDLSVGDVLIMVPDIDAYAPLIENIFTQRPGDPVIPVYLPPSFGYRSIPELLLELLKFLGRQQKVSLFIELLEHPHIQKKWKINQAEVVKLQHWMTKTSTHWGLKKGDSRFSLERALQSLYSGFSMETDSFEIIGNVVPFEEISGGENLSLVSRFSSFIHFLIDLERALKEDKSIEKWLTMLSQWVDALQLKDEVLNKDFLEKLIVSVSYSESIEPIPLDILIEWYEQQIMDQQAQASRIGSGVVVSSYIPYRNIPFKSVAILGFNESVFPRNPFRPAFDLIAQKPLPGERLTKTDDELLFLERLAATSNHFHVSYVGEGPGAGLPSILLQQFKDGLSPESYKEVHHKLHAFDEFEASEYSNYVAELMASSKENETSVETISTDFKLSLIQRDSNVIQLNELISFFAHPCKYLAKNALDILEVFENELPKDREAFKLSGLEKYQVKDSVVEARHIGVDESQLRNYLFWKGELPDGISGLDGFSSITNQIDLLMNEVKVFGKEPETIEEIRLEIGEYILTGSLHDIYGSDVVKWRIGELKAKHKIELWIHHLILSILRNEPINSHYFGIKTDKIQTYELNPVPNAMENLMDLIEVYGSDRSLTDFACLIPECSEAYATGLSKGGGYAEEKALENWEGGYSRGAASDFYNEWFWKDGAPLDHQDFQELAQRVWNPILAHQGGRK